MKWYFWVVFQVLVNVASISPCNVNVLGLEAIFDIENNVEIQIKDTPSSENEAIYAALSLIELNYFLTTGNYYNLSASLCRGLPCENNVTCALGFLTHNHLYSSYEYSHTRKNTLGRLFFLDHYTPIHLTSVKVYEGFPKMFNDSATTVNYLIELLKNEAFISYVDDVTLFHDDGYNENGYTGNDDSQVVNSLNSLNSYNRAIIIVGICEDEFEDVYLKYNAMQGYAWGCEGYGYVRITDYENTLQILNNGGILNSIVRINITSLFAENLLYAIDSESVKIIEIVCVVALSGYMLAFLGSLIYLCIWLKKRLDKRRGLIDHPSIEILPLPQKPKNDHYRPLQSGVNEIIITGDDIGTIPTHS